MSAPIRIRKALTELNISLDRAVEYLAEHGHEIDRNPNAKLTQEQYGVLVDEFEADKSKKVASEQVSQQKREEKEILRAEKEAKRQADEDEEPEGDAQPEAKAEEAPAAKEEKEETPAPAPVKEEAPAAEEKEAPAVEAKEEAPQEEATPDDGVIRAKAKLGGLKSLGKIDLEPKKKAKKEEPKAEEPKEEPKKEEPAKKEAPKAEEKKAEKPAPKAEEKKEEAKPAAKKEEAAPAPKTEKQEEKAEKPAEQPAAASNEAASEEKPKDGTHTTKYVKLDGPKFTGEKVDLSKFEKPKKKKVASSTEPVGDKKGKRKRIRTGGPGGGPGGNDNRRGGKGQGNNRGGNKKQPKVELTDEQIQQQIKETLEKLTGNKKSKSSKMRRERRAERREAEALAEAQREEQSKVLKVTEFVTATELANMMNTNVNEIISTFMSLGMMVTMNQRLDGETLQIVAEEFGYEVEFVDQEVTEAVATEEDKEEDLKPRSPIVTVMGHVDHGKTSLLDYIRRTNVIAGEAGGITQHIGAYHVSLEDGQTITFLDTPGHEAFTAMRARGAQVTDVAIIVVAADDAVMPQTKEAISHAQAAGVPIVFAINKVDRDTANPDKIKEQLAGMNLLVEDWGGKIQSQDVSAKKGSGVQELLEKVLLEAEILDLKANPDRNAQGTIVEAMLDKGRGYVATILVQNGTLKVGDYVLAGQYSGKVRALLDERGHRIDEAGPSTPAAMLGLDGAPTAGDTFIVMDDEREAKQIAQKRQQLAREQSARSQKNLTLEEIGRRLAVGDFKELNIILKGDVDGSIEALSDSLQRLTTEEIQVNIIHKAVGQISESDVLLASASDAIIVGFQVRPSPTARKLAEKEDIDIRLYSIIYDAIEEIKSAMEGMLSAEVKEEITGNVEVRETFKISKVGTIAGCMVLDGIIKRNSMIRVVRDGVVIYSGELGSLKRFKDDVKEVSKGYECGLNVKNFNDIKVGDIIEAYEEVEVKRTLD
ncbi:MAG: translation initiation factor IF-2 [Flavobacteriia bacterium]|nr:translation initiation factor IF-2 [Flavobacteriia bacterium]